MLPPRPSTPEEPMPKVYYDPSFGKDSVVDVELRESGHLRDDVPIKVTLDAAADASAAEAVKKKMTRVRSQTLDYSPHDLQSARPLETFEFERNVVVKSDGELKNVTTESQRLANSPIPQNSSTTQKSDIPDAKALSKEVATLSTAAASTAHKSATSHTTDEPLSDAADLTTSSTTAGFVESKAAEPPNEVDEKSTIDSSGRKVIKPVSRRSAKTSIDPAHTAQGYFAPKKAPSSTHTTAASPSSTTSKAHSTSAFKPPVPEQQAASTPNPTTPTNPFYATNMTLPIAAGNIIAYFREASQWLTFWRDTLSTSELADLLRAKWDPKLKQITWHFACTVEFLEKGREGWKLTRLPEEFFNDALELVEGVGGLVGEMKERKRCQGVFEGVMGDVERVGRLLVGRREARWEAGLKAKGESG